MGHRVATRQIYQAGKITIERALPISGEIFVQKGQDVSESDAIGQTTLPGSFVIVNVGQALGVSEPDVRPFLFKAENDRLQAGEIIGESRRKFPFSKSVCKSPVKGRLVAVAGKWLLIEREVEIEIVTAFVSGRVVDLYQNRGVAIETVGAYIEAACGFGGEAYGALQSVSDDVSANIDPEAVTLAERRTILLAGKSVSQEAIRALEKTRVTGLIVGSFDAALLELDPPSKIPIVATEGFGDHPMAEETFALLQSRLGDLVSIRGSLPAATSSEQPVIIIPRLPADETSPEIPPETPAKTSSDTFDTFDTFDALTETPAAGYVTVGSRVRNLREPGSMVRGQITAIQESPQMTPADVAYWGAEVSFPQGTQFVPWFNLEQIRD